MSTPSGDSTTGDHDGPEDTYFTCTLGQARIYNELLEFKNIPTFLDELVERHGEKPAVGFWDVDADAGDQSGTSNGGRDGDAHAERKDYTIYTFAEAVSHSDSAARYITQLCGTSDARPAAMLVRSVPDFLFCFLGLIRLGRPVLLLAPQLSGSAIATLCRQCEAELLYEGGAYDELVRKAVEAAASLDGFELKTHRLDFQLARSDVATASKGLVCYTASPNDTAYLHHTSGTSTGLPKPIPQSHNAGCGVQPRLEGSDAATFTTTPLYHGGVADLFRAWTSGAMMWTFPGDKLPITAKNVSRCLQVAASATLTKEGKKVPKVEYFSSVPYVLQGMADHPLGLSQLQTMSIVGVGGAALPVEVGDALVHRGVNLISRFGSAECGFLLSSHRPFATDPSWQYLRAASRGSKSLRFEPREGEDGLCELVVLPGWPHMAKTNREDGSFATSDLFERHATIPDAWRYHSRADGRLTLVTGKKFDPAPLEAGIAASSSWIGDVLIFGNGKPYPGVLVFKAEEAKGVEDGVWEEEVWKVVEKFNREGQSHTRISRGMVVLLGEGEGEGLEKSSKGTVIRRVAEERFKEVIERAYGKGEGVGGKEVSDEDVLGEVRRIVERVMGSETKDGEKLTDTVDLFTYGADSVSCIQIRQKLAGLLGTGAGPLPPTIVEDCGSIRILSQTILDIRHGKASTNAAAEDQIKLMQDFVETYSTLTLPSLPSTPSSHPPPTPSTGKTILLTGSTGSLGSHLLSQLLSIPSISHIHLLLRGPSLSSARSRLLSLLASRHLPPPPTFDSRVTLHLYTLTAPHLGLADEVYLRLAQEVDVIYDLAWSVNFLLPLRGFRPHFQALQSLLSLAAAHAGSEERGTPARVVFCSSTASVASYPSSPGRRGALVPERILGDVEVSGGIGYSRSKWVAENLIQRAVEKYAALKGCVSVVRVGQISGDTVHGVWNQSEAYPLLLGSARVTGCLPTLKGEKVGWTGVDVAAGGFVSLLDGDGGEEGREGVRVLHLLNPKKPVGWDEVVGWIAGEVETGIEVVEVGVWLGRLEGLRRKEEEEEEEREHACLKLLEFWRGAYGKTVDGESVAEVNEEKHGEKENGSVDDRPPPPPPQAEGFDMSQSVEAMPGLKEAKAVDREYVLKLWRWIRENI